MIRLHVKRGLMGAAGVESTDVLPQGQTAADLVRRHAPADWALAGLRIVVAVDGRPVDLAGAEEPVPDDCDVVIGPDVGEVTTIVLAIVYVALLVGGYFYAKYQSEKALAKLNELGDGQQRNEDTSPTYSWDGISTTYGQGVTIPVVFGYHAVGGHVIFQAVVADSAQYPGIEFLRIILALSLDRIEAIGGVLGGAAGEFDAYGGLVSTGPVGPAIPTGITINGNRFLAAVSRPGIRVWGRLGEPTQSPLPAPFSGASLTEAVGEQLDAAGASRVHTILDTGLISTVGLIFHFPGGLYRTDPVTGAVSATSVSITLRWRLVGTTAWQQFVDPQRGPINGLTLGGSLISTQTYTSSSTLHLLAAGGEVSGPLEIQATRTTPAGGVGVVDSCVWRQVIWSSPHVFSYPSTALIALEVEGSERVGGGNPQVRVPVRGRRVRVWDPVNGWSPYCFDSPPAPHNYYSAAVGRNNAWIVVEMALARTSWGLGDQLTQADIDLEAFARWGVYCDEFPTGWSEPRYRFDGVFDTPRSAWEAMQQVAAAGNAVLYWVGSRLSVVYRYRDAHASGPISVPAKSRSQVFPSSIVRNLVVRYLPRRTRPTVFDYQYLDQDQNWEQATLPVEDPTVDPTGRTIGDPEWRREPQQLFGVTRATQLFRQGRYEHALNRLVPREIVFEVPHFALAAALGDVIGVQQEWLRPFTSETLGLTIAEGGDAVSVVKLDQAVTIPPSVTTQLVIRNPTGGVDVAAITLGAGTYPAGTSITLAGPVSALDGAPCAFGRENAVVDDWEIQDLTLTQDLWRKVRATTWVPEVYDVPDPSEFESGNFDGGTDSLGGGDFGQWGGGEVPASLPAEDIRVRRSPDRRSMIDVGFVRPLDRPGGLARVLARPAGGGDWSVLGETAASHVTAQAPAAVAGLDVAVVVESRGGVYAPPTTYATVVVDEFPNRLPLPPRDVRVDAHELGVRVSWLRTDAVVEYYEVRRGASWDNADVVCRTSDAWFVDHEPKPLTTGISYFVAARLLGQYSIAQLAQDPTALGSAHMPPGTATQAAFCSEITLSPTGTKDGVDYADDPDDASVSGMTQVGDLLEGRYTTLELVMRDGDAAELEAAAWWSVTAQWHGRDEQTVDDWTFEVDSGESLWRSIDERPPSLGTPGVSRQTVDEAFPSGISLELAEAVGTDQLAFGRAGEVGERWFVELESRYYTGGAWGAWALHRDGRRTASRMQVRANLVRESLDVRVWLTHLSLAAYL